MGSDRPPTDRERLAQRIADLLDPFLMPLGVLWLAAWVVEPLLDDGSGPSRGAEFFGYGVWAFFGVEFILRVIIAPDTREYLRTHWWEIVILVVPVFRFIRLLRVIRLAKLGRALPAAFRASRSAERTLAGRVGMLAVVSVVVILGAGRALYEWGGIKPYGHALRFAALSGLTGKDLPRRGEVAYTIEILLVIYSVIVLATLASSLGAYLLRSRSEDTVAPVKDDGGVLAPSIPSGPIVPTSSRRR